MTIDERPRAFVERRPDDWLPLVPPERASSHYPNNSSIFITRFATCLHTQGEVKVPSGLIAVWVSASFGVRS